MYKTKLMHASCRPVNAVLDAFLSDHGAVEKHQNRCLLNNLASGSQTHNPINYINTTPVNSDQVFAKQSCNHMQSVSQNSKVPKTVPDTLILRHVSHK